MKHGNFPIEAIPKGGFLGDYTRAMEKTTESPTHFHLICGLEALATIIGRRAWIPWTGKRLFPNLYVLLLGPSSVVKKSTATDLAVQVLNWYGDMTLWQQDLVRSTRGSPEAFISELIESEGQGLYNWDEYYSFEALCHKNYAEDLRALFTELHGCPENIKVRTQKGGPKRLDKPYICFLSSSTETWFEQMIGQTEYQGGWLPRFLLIPGQKPSKMLPVPPAITPKDEEAIRGHLGKLIDFPETKFTLDLESYIDFYKETWRDSQKETEILAPLLSRSTTYAVKLAMLYTVNSILGHGDKVTSSTDKTMSPVPITQDAMDRAISIIKWVRSSVRELIVNLSLDRDQKLTKEVGELIDNNPGISSRELYRRFHKSKKAMEEIFNTLEVTGYERSEGERKNEVWFPWGNDTSTQESRSAPNTKTPIKLGMFE